MLQIRYMDIMKDNERMNVGLIFGVATNKKYEGCGYMKQLMNHVLNQYSKPFIFIQAYNWDIYKSFGFEEAYTYKQSTFKSMGEFNGELCYDSTHLLNLYLDYLTFLVFFLTFFHFPF